MMQNKPIMSNEQIERTCIEKEEEEHSDIKATTRKSPYEDNVKYIDNIITAIDAN